MNTRLLASKVFYFCWFAAMGAWLPFISLYYRQIGLTPAQIGLLAALGGIVQIVATPLWGVLADLLRLRRALLPLAIVCSLLPMSLVGSRPPWALLLLLIPLLQVLLAPVIPLADSATLALLGPQRERYGAQRVWGSFGWSASTLLVGWLTEPLGYRAIFAGYAALALLAAGAALRLPAAPAAPAAPPPVGGLLRDRRWYGFLGGVLLISSGGSALSSFLSLHLDDLGASGTQVGLAQTIASGSELPVMALSPLLLRRWGARALLLASGLCYALRMLLVVAAPSSGWVLASQALHGLCYGLLCTAGVVAAQQLTPPGLEATGQSLFGIATFGLAASAANALGGPVYGEYGAGALFGGSAVAAALGCTTLALGWRGGGRSDAAHPY